jgi:hypothetical protein
MYYTARVQLEFETDKGGTKKKSETYLVKAESVTDAEAIIHEKFAGYTMGFEVKSVSASRIIDVYSAE